MHPRLLKTFLAVASARNMTRAADEVHLSQSSVSDQIQSLEAELGVDLFTRSKLGLDLTPAGETLRVYAEDILAQLHDARAAVKAAAGQAAAALSIGALETIAATKLPSLLATFRGDHPGIDLRLTVAGSGELMRKLEAGDLDVAFCFDKGDDERFIMRTVSVEPLVLVAPPGSQPALDTAGLAALASRRFVATEVGCVYRRVFDLAFAEAGVSAPKLAAEAGSIRAIARLVAAGAGLALVPRLAVTDALDRGEIVEMSWPGPVKTALLTAIWRRRRIQPPALKLLLGALSRLPVRSADARPRRAVPSLS
jgi:DNA-binding transcriptional LysR family regulator